MFIYRVFRVVNSSAPVFGGDQPSKLRKVGVVRANNSKFACDAAREYHELDDGCVLFAHPIIMDEHILDAVVVD